MGLDNTTLEVIKVDNPESTGQCFTVMLSEWLKIVEPRPSWEQLFTALQKPSVGHAALVEEVKKKLGMVLESTVDCPLDCTKAGKIRTTYIELL